MISWLVSTNQVIANDQQVSFNQPDGPKWPAGEFNKPGGCKWWADEFK